VTRRVISRRYELEELPIARGGMGEVWVGRDVKLEREIAVKFLRFPDGTPDTELVRRFVRESRITARLEHPGIPAVYDVGTEDGTPYLVMQRIRGSTVADLVAELGALPIGWAAAIAAQTCAVLAVAHQASLVHRDLKPGNLMLCPDGTVKVLDFGLAVALDLADVSQITRTGQTLGTPAYMAPEQVMAGLSGPQTDLYALGCTLYEMLTGRQLFGGPTPYSVMSKQVDERPAPARRRRPDVPKQLDDLLLDLLRKRPEDRPESAGAVFGRLMPFVGDLGPLPPVLDPAAGGTAVRMYADVVSRVFDVPPTSHGGARPEQPTGGVSPTPAPSAEPFSRGELERARQDATVLIRQSRYSQAAEVLAAVAEPATRALGRADPAVVSLRFELANVLFEGGDYRGAAPVYQQLATDLSAHDGPDAELVFRCRLQEATCHALVGQTAAAIDQLEALLRDERRAFGPDDPRILELRRQIGLLQLGAGRTDQARIVLTELLADLERLHGPDHPTTGRVRDLLAGIRRTGD